MPKKPKKITRPNILTKRRPPAPKPMTKKQFAASVEGLDPPSASGGVKVLIRGDDLLRKAMADIAPRMQDQLRKSLEAIAYGKAYVRGLDIATTFDPKSPLDGFYWARRDDGRLMIAEVLDGNGYRAVRFFGNLHQRLPLKTIAQNFVFVKRIEPPSE